MRNRSKYLAQASIIGALYLLLTHLQNLLLPGSASFFLQCRLSDALCILALLTPAAVPGLTVGCLLFNLTFAGALPLDWLLGSLATYLAAAAMHRLRRFPLPALVLPALTNGLLVGWELSLYLGGGFLLSAAYVAAGELLVLLLPGWGLYALIRRRKLGRALKFD